ncbi:MAG TPA: FkbM family methyltransferase [Gammaproteobacteria bacterium]|nr:FkbM family methyltransferase [Gammaproteobacteria bacterium]
MLKSLFRRLGYSLQRINKAESEEDILFKALRLGGVGLVIDCGANHGQFYHLCRRSGFTGPIWCIDPNPYCLATLNALAEQDAALKIIPAGTGDHDALLPLNSAGALDDLSSFLDQTPLLTSRFKRAEVTETMEAQVRRLDGLMDEEGLPADMRVFLKVDTQGYDLATLEGMGERINQVSGVKAEMSVQAAYEDAPSHWELLEFFRTHDFEPFSFTTVTRDFDGRYIEYDAYFLKTPRKGN